MKKPITPLTRFQLREIASWLNTAVLLSLDQSEALRKSGFPDAADAMQKRIPKLDRLIEAVKAATP